MEIYQYIHYDPVTKLVAEGFPNQPAYVLSDIVPSGDYTLLTDIQTIESIYLPIDYLKKRELLRPLIENNWINLSNEEKHIAIDLYLHDDNTEAIGYLMTIKGLSQADSILYIQESYAQHIVKDSESCKLRTTSKELTLVVIKYLSPGEATDFLNVTEKLNQLYSQRGVKGLNDGSYRAGLFDFIESTNDYVGYGLEEQGYTLNVGNYNDLKEEIMNILRHGNYGS